MKKSNKIVFVVLAVALVCSLALVSVGCDNYQSVEPVAVQSVSLEFSESLYFTTYGADYVIEDVTATILPATVVDKTVTWDLSWADNAALGSDPVSDYIVLLSTPDPLTISLKCIASFRGSNMVLTCTTRQGNKVATATVTYEGIASNLVISSPSGVSTYNLGHQTCDLLYAGQTYTLPLSMDNVFHDVGSGYDQFSYSLTAVGFATLGTYTVSGSTSPSWSNEHSTSVAGFVSSLVTVSISQSNLIIQVDKAIEAYYSSVQGSSSGSVFYGKVKSLNVDQYGDVPYIKITVTESISGLSRTYIFFTADDVSSVHLSGNSVVF